MLQYLNDSPGEMHRLTPEVPPFAVAAVIVPEAPTTLSPVEAELLALYRGYGRPLLHAPKELADQPHTNYTVINCGWYDAFEQAIVRQAPLTVRYQLPGQPLREERHQLRDLKTWKGEEFVCLATGKWLRLDCISRLGALEMRDGVPCRIG